MGSQTLAMAIVHAWLYAHHGHASSILGAMENTTDDGSR